jgi:hypothetical protein
MGLLSRKPALSEIECQRENLLHRKAALEAQRVAAERRLDEAVADRRRVLVESDQDSSQPAKNIVGRLRDERDAITDALAAIDLKLGEVENRLRQDQDRSEREKASKRCQEQIAAARPVVDRFAAVFEEAAAAMQTLSPFSISAGTTAGSLKIFGGQLRAGIEQGIAETENYRLRMVAGNAPVVGEAKPVIAAPPPPAPVERQPIYLLTDAVWPEPDGSLRYGCQYGQASPPVDVARRAIKLNLADAFNSPRANRLREIHGCPFSVPHPSTCTNLVTGERPKPEGDNGTSATPAEYYGPARAGYAVLAPARW